MLVLQLIVAFLLIQQCYSTCNAPDGGCHFPRGDGQESGTECQPINYAQEDTVRWSIDVTGHLDLRFALPSVNCGNISCYFLELIVDPNVSKEDCSSNKPIKGLVEKLLLHSKRQYAISDTCLHGSSCECEETGLVSFNFVFSGCYQAVFQPRVNTNSKMKMYSHRKYLSTNFTKDLIAGHADIDSRISVTSRYYPVTHSTQVTIAFAQLSYSQLHLEINLMENIDIFHEEACYKTGQQHSCCLIVNNTTRECTQTSTPTDRQPAQCEVSDKSISCTFSAVKPGNYCFTVQITDDRCEQNTLWTTDKDSGSALTCNWQFNFTAGDSGFVNEIRESEQKTSLTYIILAAVFTVGVAVTGIGLFALKYSRILYQRTPSSALPSSVIAREPCRIFLLYARDCQPFMELMATLREVLEDATKCEVIDCLDPSRWNDIGRNPVEWVRSHIEHSATKVVLVATECAYLRQQAHHNQTTTYYKEPGTYDSLFTYGLKTLTDNLSHDIYRKISVIRFEGFSDDGDLFSHLTPYTRFVLPLHLRKLILSLQPSISSDEDAQLVESKEVQKLAEDLKNLINYKNTNINYLQDLLIVQRNELHQV